MATRADFTDAEWKTLHQGVTGAGMLVSYADRDLSDSFGEATAMATYLAGQVTASGSQLVRELAGVHGTGFSMFSSPQRIQAETMAALASAVALLTAKAPDDLEAYRALVLGVAQATAEAKGGVGEAETAVIGTIREALGSA